MTDKPASNQDSLLGKVVVEKGLATPEEVQACLDSRRQTTDGEDDNRKNLAELLVSGEVVTRSQLDRILPEIDERQQTRHVPGYQLLERLGAGAMATVYKGRQLSLDRLVAVKILPRKFTQKPEFVQRFHDEGRAAAKLNHPNIVGALDVGKTGDTHYFVMEYVKGRTVYDDITKRSRYTEKDALEIAVQVADALVHAHRAGFIHRDVKPKNIMLTGNGTAKLADMGLARAVSDREAAEAEQGKAFGTPYYISPEQIRGEVDVDFRADIYSLGATLYHMVTGKVPFDGPNPSAVMHKHLKAELTPPDHVVSDLSSGLGEIIEVSMAKDRDKRYISADDLLEDLQAVAKGEPPMHARKMFDLSSLSALDHKVEPSELVEMHGDQPVTATPIFWLMIAGWLLSALLVVIYLITFAGQ